MYTFLYVMMLLFGHDRPTEPTRRMAEDTHAHESETALDHEFEEVSF